MKLRENVLMAFVFVTALAFVGVDRALANVTVTGASGGAGISADSAANAPSPAWTTLGAITIAEGANDDFGGGNGLTLVLKVPAGFEFNTAVTPDVTFTPNRDISSASAAFNNSTTITITLGVALLPLEMDTLTIGSSTNIQVRPTLRSPLAAGKHIFRPSSGGGSASINGINPSADGSDGSNFGNLTEVAGAAALIQVETAANGSGTVVLAQNITAGNSINAYAITRDAYSNFITNGAADAWSLPTKSGGVVDGDLVPAGDRKSAVFTGHLTGTATIGATSGTLAQNNSGMLTVVAAQATRMFVTLPNETFTAGTGNSGTVVAQTAGIPFTITRLTAADNFTNVDTTYSGSHGIYYSGPGGSPTYTTNVSFTAGQSTTTLTTTLTQPETTTILATDGSLMAITSSSLTVSPSNTPPTIAPIADRMTLIDTSVGPFNIVIGDAETPVGALTLSGTSSDTNLVPNANIYPYNFGVQTLTVTPAAGKTGTATITVTVSDGTTNTSTSFLLTVSQPGPGTMIFSNAAAITIPDSGAATPYPSTINVAGMQGTITNVTLTLRNVSHTNFGNVDMLLVDPSGLKRVVICSATVNQAVNNVTFTLSDLAEFGLPPSSALPAGTYKPTEFTHNFTNSPHIFPAPAPAPPYASTLSTFNGLSANGTWSLYVFDSVNPNHGTISNGWRLTITTTPPPPVILPLVGAATTNVVIRWSAVSNVTYRVQYQSNLNSANWSNLVPDVTATTNTASTVDHPIGAARRFYRVLALP